MKYTEALQHKDIASALAEAGLSEIKSPMLKDGDFSIGDELTTDMITLFMQGEIKLRRLQKEREDQELNELKFQEAQKHPEWQAYQDSEKQKPANFKEKVAHIRPHVEKLIKGNLAEPFDTTEDACIDNVSEYTAKHFNYEPGETESKTEDYSGLNELQALLKKSSITRLSNKMSIEEIALRGLHQSKISKFLK